MIKNTSIRSFVCICLIGEDLDLGSKVIQEVFGGKPKPIEEIKKAPPQLNGGDCQRLSAKFPKVAEVFHEYPTIQNSLLEYQHQVDTLCYQIFEDEKATSQDIWWTTRIIHILFVTLFGDSQVIPALAELSLCAPLYVKNFEARCEEAGVELPIYALSEWVCEHRHLFCKDELIPTNQHMNVDNPRDHCLVQQYIER